MVFDSFNLFLQFTELFKSIFDENCEGPLQIYFGIRKSESIYDYRMLKHERGMICFIAFFASDKDTFTHHIDKLIWEDLDPQEQFRLMEMMSNDFDEHENFTKPYLTKYFRKIDYTSSFLQTRYWETISKYKKFLNPECQLCNSTKNLNTHHPTYDIRGMEINNIHKLTVLCGDCHGQFHKNKKVK